MSMVIRWLGMLVWVVWAGVGVAQEVDPGEGYFQRGQFEQAAEVWEKRLMELSPINSSEEYVDVSVQLATSYQLLGRLQRALEVLQQAEPHTQKIRNSERQAEYRAEIFIELSNIYLAMRDLRNQQIEWVNEVRVREKFTLFTRQEIINKAEEYLNKAECLVSTSETNCQSSQKASNPSLWAEILNRKGNLLMVKKEYANALMAYQRSLAKQDDKVLKANTWVNIVQVYAEILSHLQKSMILAKKYQDDEDSGGQIKPMIKPSVFHFIHAMSDSSDRPQAEIALGQVVQSIQDKTSNNSEGLEWMNFEEVSDAGSKAKATFEIALKEAIDQVNKLSDSHDKSFALIALAQQLMQVLRPLPTKDQSSSFFLPLSPKHKKFAYDILMVAFYIADKQGDKRAIAYAKSYLADLYAEEKRYQEAIRIVREAIFQARNYPQLRVELWGYPDLLFRLEWQLGKFLKVQSPPSKRPEKCQDLNNTSAYECAYERATKYLQQVNTTYASVSQSFYQEAIQFHFDQVELLLEQATVAQTEQEEQDLLRKTIDRLESFKANELQSYFSDYCVTEKFPLVSSNPLPKGTAVFYPLLLENGRVELLLRSREKIQRFTPPKIFTATFLERQANKFILNLTEYVKERVAQPENSEFGFLPYAEELYKGLIEPISKELEEVDTLVIVPHGILLTIPFAALYDGKKHEYLVQKKYTLSVTHRSLSRLELPEQTKNVALIGGLTQEYSVPSLSFVECELNEIVRLIKQGKTRLDMSAKESRDKEFTVTKIREILGKYPMVAHFSTHGSFDSDDLDKIYLQIIKEDGQKEGQLKLEELEKLIQHPLELMSFSSCQSGTTPQQSPEATFGLVGIAVKAGVRNALATLWSVDDPSTALLMIEFYKRWLGTPTLSIAQALQEAQKFLINMGKTAGTENKEDNNETLKAVINKRQMESEDNKTSEKDLPCPPPPQKYYNDPFFWAAFIVIEN